MQVLFSPGSRFLNKFNIKLRVSEIRKVHRVLESLTTLLQYQHELDYMIADSHQNVTTNTTLQAVVDDTCIWVSAPETISLGQPLIHPVLHKRAGQARLGLYYLLSGAELYLFLSTAQLHHRHCI